MISDHPTETADTGKLQSQSFYIKKSDIPDEIVLCAQCGFPTDLRQHPSGDSYGAVGNPCITTQGYRFPSPRLDPGISGTVYSQNIYFGVFVVDTISDPQPTAGCPLCGTLNPQGKGRGQSGFDRSVKSILGL